MSQSLSRVLVHCIFSTKGHRPWICPEIQSDLHAYLGGIVRKQGCWSIEIGGVQDHVHILVGLARTISAAGLVSALKAGSSKWMKEKHKGLSDFQWQAVYAIFSVDPLQLDPLCHYIRNQAEHHRGRDFQDEYREFLKAHGIQFEEKYVWD